jgi:hypothetical protein
MTMPQEVGLASFESDLRYVHRQIVYKKNAFALALLSGYCATLSANGISLDGEKNAGLRDLTLQTMGNILTKTPTRKERGRPLKTAHIADVCTIIPEAVSVALRDNPHRIDLKDTNSLRRLATLLPEKDAKREALGAYGRIYTGCTYPVPTKMNGTKYVPMAIKQPNGYVHYIFDLFTGEKAHILRTPERNNTLAHCTKGVFHRFSERAEEAFAIQPR